LFVIFLIDFCRCPADLFWPPDFSVRNLSGTPVNFGAPQLSRCGLGQGSRLGARLVLPLTVPVGDEELKIQFNLRGREWNGPQGIKYFNTLEAWRIERFVGGNSSAAPTQNTNTATPGANTSSAAPVFTGNPGDNDDLPF